MQSTKQKTKFTIATPALCGDGVTLADNDEVFLMDTLIEAENDILEDDPDGDMGYYPVEVAQNADGDWVGTEDGINWSEVARRQLA